MNQVPASRKEQYVDKQHCLTAEELRTAWKYYWAASEEDKAALKAVILIATSLSIDLHKAEFEVERLRKEINELRNL